MLLAIDTSTRRMGLALYDGAEVLTEMMWTSPFHHTMELAPAVELALQRAGLNVHDLRALGVATGPGSFTALRIGLAFAKGLALARGVPLIGIPSLDVLAASQPVTDAPLFAVLEAGRTRLAGGWYAAPHGVWIPDGEPQLLSPEGLSAAVTAPAVVSGELNAGVREILGRNPFARVTSPAGCVRRPAVLAELAWGRWQSGGADDPGGLAPIYVAQGEAA